MSRLYRLSASGKAKALPAPVGGWDTLNALADMPEENAVVMDNFFPDTDRVKLRRGFVSHATGMSGNVESLLEYRGVDGTNEIWAANGGNIYDVSGGGAVGAAAVTGMTNDRWQFTQMNTTAGNFLLAVNGADTPREYDGSSWSTASITGPTAANLIWTNTHQRRIWVGEEDSMSAWYLGVNSKGGSATEFPMGGLASKGGYLMAMGTWTRDGGAGTDDVAVFLTSEGQAILYAGTDPSAVATWSLVGVFDIGEPIGRRCLVKAGSDLIVITQQGFVSMSTVLSLESSQTERVALSRQIAKTVNDDVRDNAATYGWQPHFYPLGKMLIFNVPQGSSVYHQYVFNTITGAPCRFTGLNAICWGHKDGKPFFGSTDGKVYEFDSGGTDDGANVVGDCLQAFSYFKSPSQVKAFKLVEPVFQSAQDPTPAIDMLTDFNITKFTGTTPAAASSGAVWDTAVWDTAVWSGNEAIFRKWRGVRGIGRSGAVRLQLDTDIAQPAWISTNVIYNEGGVV